MNMLRDMRGPICYHFQWEMLLQRTVLTREPPWNCVTNQDSQGGTCGQQSVQMWQSGQPHYDMNKDAAAAL